MFRFRRNLCSNSHVPEESSLDTNGRAQHGQCKANSKSVTMPGWFGEIFSKSNQLFHHVLHLKQRGSNPKNHVNCRSYEISSIRIPNSTTDGRTRMRTYAIAAERKETNFVGFRSTWRFQFSSRARVAFSVASSEHNSQTSS